MENINYKIGTKVIMKKEHPCKNNIFEVVRLGADIKVRCIKCDRLVLMPRIDFNKKIKKIVEK